MNEENEATNETQNDLDKEDDQNVVKDNDDKENIENEGQRVCFVSIEWHLNVLFVCQNSDTDLDDETNDENNDNEDEGYLNPQEEYELKENILKNLESEYWESLLKGMCQLKNTKEE